MKKPIAVILSLLLMLSCMAGCVAPPAPVPAPEATQAPAPEVEQAQDEEAKPEEAPAPAAEKTVLRLSTTTSVNDSGLLPFLQAEFEKAYPYTLEIISNGTGAAIKLGETGDADVLLVHAKASEEEFVNGGFGVERIPFMHNYFVVVGEKGDKAGISQSESAADAFVKIADAKAEFVSRGDDSGTHKAELKIWKETGIDPSVEPWYISAGKGMGACLTQASEMKAYCLTDKSTYLSMKDKLELDILLEESADMKNVYSLIAVNPEKSPGVNAQGANDFIAFMMGDVAKDIIATYGQAEYGNVLFMLGE